MFIVTPVLVLMYKKASIKKVILFIIKWKYLKVRIAFIWFYDINHVDP